jgi:hypothetical protein
MPVFHGSSFLGYGKRGFFEIVILQIRGRIDSRRLTMKRPPGRYSNLRLEGISFVGKKL